MKVGDLIRWEWYNSGAGTEFDPWEYKQYQGIIIDEGVDRGVRVLTVVDKLGSVVVRADEAEVISESR